MPDKQIKMPNALALIFFIMVLAACLTWIIPAGEFDRSTNAEGREVVVGGTYHTVPSQPQGLFALLQSPVKGIIETAKIIAFILIVGGVFAIIERTQVISTTIVNSARRLRSAGIWVIPGGGCFFFQFLAPCSE